MMQEPRTDPLSTRSALRDPISRSRSRREGCHLAGPVPALLPALRSKPTTSCSTSGPGLASSSVTSAANGGSPSISSGLSGRTLPPGTEEVFTPSHRLSEQIPANSVDWCSAATSSSICPIRQRFWRRYRRSTPCCGPVAACWRYSRTSDLWAEPTGTSSITICRLPTARSSRPVESLGFEIVEVIPRFLPYTTRSAIPQSPWLVRLYLAVRPVWWLLGKQTFLVAKKRGADAPVQA